MIDMSCVCKKVAVLMALVISGITSLFAQQHHCDTLELKIFFKRDVSAIDLSYRDNAQKFEEFQVSLNNLLADSSAVVRYMEIRTSASPEGSTGHNQNLSEARAESIDRYLTEELGMDPHLFRYEAVGEDWEGLAEILKNINTPPRWLSEALDIIENTPQWVVKGGKIVDSRKNRLKRLEGGQPWKWMDEHIFPELRAGGGSVRCVIQRPVREVISQTDTVYVPYTVTQTQTDTVFVASETAPRKTGPDRTGRKFLFAARTNVFAVPLANVGIEIPLSRNWSIGADYYYPWIWRDDIHKTCNELLALDIEARYWFNNRKHPENSRLLGHSIGVYAAAGYYDFERNWFGHQGEFLNAGIDYLFACPIFRGRMHLEFELGLGYIYSEAQPYDCFKAGDKCYRRKGVREYIHWVGPTRAQFSLVIPFWSKRKGGER